jgi:hypothetical protein
MVNIYIRWHFMGLVINLRYYYGQWLISLDNLIVTNTHLVGNDQLLDNTLLTFFWFRYYINKMDA